MAIQLHNTLTRAKEAFRPLDPHNVRLYFCGPTVWNYAHIGNARGPVIYGLLAAVLRHRYGANHVKYVSNFTDIDDKIMDAAKEQGVKISDITEKFARIYNEDMAALGVARPDVQPKATDYVPAMVNMIESLVAKGHAYAAEGHVLFNVPSWPAYGGLSRKNRDDLVAGARVDVAPYKKDPADFVLWKPSTGGQPGWDSPWGFGRPGWHIECSAMNAAINGAHFDIHTGGEDLIFPHHENEIAQSVCAHGGTPYANIWMHHGHLMVEGKKMSKSTGNVLLVHDLIEKYPAEALRLVLLSAHYRQPFDFTDAGVAQAKSTLDRWYGVLRDNEAITAVPSALPAPFIAALEDDLNTPKALAEVSQIVKRLSTGDTREKGIAKGELQAVMKMLGLLQAEPSAWFAGATGGEDDARIDALIAARADAKKSKDFARADAIRRELDDSGILLEDTAQGTRWKRK